MTVDRLMQRRPSSPKLGRAGKARKATVRVEPLEGRALLSRLLPEGVDLTPQFQEIRAGTGIAY